MDVSFNSIYQHYYRKAFLFTKSYVHDEMAAEDIVSESLIKLWDVIKKNPDIAYEGLLITILKNRSLDYLKHESIKNNSIQTITEIYQHELDIRISTLQACDPQDLLSSEIKEIIEKTLSQIPQQSRLVFELSRFSDKSNKEIAEELGLSVKAVEYHITKTIKLLRLSLKDYLYLLIISTFFIK